MRAVTDAVAGMLRAAGVAGVFDFAPSAMLCAEPAVVRWSGFSRESRQDGEERGTASVEMLVVREKDAEARDAAFACEADGCEGDMTVRKEAKGGADGGRGAWRDRRDPLADVRLSRSSDRFQDEELSAREQRRAVSYGRARGRL